MTGYAMQISSAAIALIKKQQGLSLEKYRDEKGIWVIGYGHVILRLRPISLFDSPAASNFNTSRWRSLNNDSSS